MLTNIEKSGDPELVTREFTDIKSRLQIRKLPRYPRASSLYKDCMRQLVLLNINGIEEKEYTGFSKNVMFDIGKSVHFWAQNTKSLVSNSLRSGFWKCKACGFTTPFSKRMETQCPVCGASPKAFIYEEYSLVLKNPVYVTGHPDMFVEKPDNNYRVMEFKTINSKGFDELKAPLIEHLWQLQTYMWGISKDPLSKEIQFDSKYGYIMYISKVFKMMASPVKTFVVQKDKVVLKEIMMKLESFKKGLEKKIIPAPIDTCVDSNFYSYTAKNCPVLEFCKKSS